MYLAVTSSSLWSAYTSTAVWQSGASERQARAAELYEGRRAVTCRGKVQVQVQVQVQVPVQV